MMTFTQEIGLRVRKRRKQLNMTQDELARKLGYQSKSSIAKIEAGERDLPQSKIKAIADALSTSPGYIMGWTEEEPQIDIDTLTKAVNMAIESTRRENPTRMDKLMGKIKKLSEADLKRLEAIIDAWTGEEK